MKQTGLEKILGKLCVKFGYCLSYDEQTRIAKSCPETPEALVEAVIRGEGGDPEIVDRHMYRQMRELVVEHWHWLE